jgi:hypothetical protein
MKHDNSFILCWQFVIAFFNSSPAAMHRDPGSSLGNDRSAGGVAGKMTVEYVKSSLSFFAYAASKSTFSIDCKQHNTLETMQN